MFIKKPKHRKFDYQPKYYKSEQDPEERKKRRLGFRSAHKQKTSKKKSPIAFILMLLIIVYIFLKYQGLI